MTESHVPARRPVDAAGARAEARPQARDGALRRARRAATSTPSTTTSTTCSPRSDEIRDRRPERDPPAALMRTLRLLRRLNTWGYIPGSNGRRYPALGAVAGTPAKRARRRLGGGRRRPERPHRGARQPGLGGPQRAPVPRAVPALACAGRPRSSSSSARTTSGRPARCRSAMWRGRSVGWSSSRARPRPGRTAARPRCSSSARRRSTATRLGPHFATCAASSTVSCSTSTE